MTTEHDFRYSLFNPQHTLTECRTLAPGRYQVTGQGGHIQAGDTLLITLKGSRDLFMRLTVEKTRHLISPAGQWVAVAKGPIFRKLTIQQQKIKCNGCETSLSFEYAFDAALGSAAETTAKTNRISELGWSQGTEHHLCPRCQTAEAICVANS